jgi:hypothetical protein
LDPIIDDEILKVGGRLDRSDMTQEAKHPIILPKKSRIARLILEDVHKSHGHLGKNTIPSIVRQQYWILGESELAKSVTSKCVSYRRYQAPIVK